MRFHILLLAVSATSAAAACVGGKKPHSSASSSPPAATAPAASAPASSYEALLPTLPTGSSSPVATSAPPAASSAAPSPAAANNAASSGSSSSGSSSGDSSSVVTGEATFYGGNLSGGTCSFTTLTTIPGSLFGTAYSGAVWDSAAQCGTCVKVTGPNGNFITAMVVDKCPECDKGHLDLFEDGFLELGSESAGIIDISYEVVSCGLSTPLSLHSKSGTSAYFFSMQVVGANEAVASLEVSTDSGSTWQATARTDYNFFEHPAGFGTESVDVRVTGASGATVVVSGASCASDAQTTAASNL